MPSFYPCIIQQKDSSRPKAVAACAQSSAECVLGSRPIASNLMQFPHIQRTCHAPLEDDQGQARFQFSRSCCHLRLGPESRPRPSSQSCIWCPNNCRATSLKQVASLTMIDCYQLSGKFTEKYNSSVGTIAGMQVCLAQCGSRCSSRPRYYA